MARVLTTALLACALAACGGSQQLDQPADAGEPFSPPPSSSSPSDAGPPIGDAGAPIADAGAPIADAGASAPTPGPRIGNCPVFPANNDFNRDVSADPVDPHSSDYLAALGAATLLLHPDFGESQYGLPYATVGTSQPLVSMTFRYPDQSDPGPYPFPPDVPIQGGANATGDRHAIVVDTEHCQLYETYLTYPAGGGFRADSGARFDLLTGAARPDGWTSATASGLPLFPALARPEEVLDDKALRHALTFTAGATAHAYVAPATHSSGTSSAQYAPPMGLRVRLKASFDLTGFTGASRVILEGLRHYGMLLGDNADGSFWSFGGAQSARWPVGDLDQLKTVPASAFEVVQLGAIKQGQ